MSSGSIRIIQLPEKSSVNTGDYMAVDSSANGTKKVKFTDLLDDNLSTQNKAADAQATGEAISGLNTNINNTNTRIDNMINSQQNASVTTLWTGTLKNKNQSVTLSKSIANFDFIDVYCGGVESTFVRKPVANSITFHLQQQNMSDDASVQGLRWWESGLTISGTTATITKCVRCYWDDFSQVPVVSQATDGIEVIRIDGVKIGHVENDEIVDARVGANGTTYPTLGDAIRGQVTDLEDEFNDFKNGNDTLDGNWVIGVLDGTTVYPNLKYMVCNPTIQQYSRNIVFNIASGYYLNVNYFDAGGTRTAAHSNKTGSFTVPSGQRFNVSVTENPFDSSIVISDMTRFVNAITFNTIIENRIETLEAATREDSELVDAINDGNTFILDNWQVGALDKTTVYPNVDKFTLSNPTIRSFNSDVVVHVKSGFKYTINVFNENGERTAVVNNIAADRTFKKGERFNLYVNRNPVDSTEVITNETKIEFQSAVYFRGNLGQELDELKKSVDPTAEPNDYYFADNYLENKCTAIDTLAKSCAAQGDVFIFISDEHWTLNEKQSMPLIRYISKHCNIPRVFDGGDGDDYGSNDFCTALKNSFNHKIYHVAGNHDWMPSTDGNMLYYWMDMYNNDQIGNPVEHYYYVDNVQKNIRYIIINAWINDNGTLTSGYSAEQLSWFTNTALNVPNDWDILVFSHYVGDTVTPSPTGANYFRDAIDAYNANASHTGKVIAIISGHAHCDTVCHTSGGVPIIITTCDKNKENGVGNEPWLPQYRPSGTIYEQAFDVMFLDRVNKTITALRIGCPAMDNTDIMYGDAGFDYAPTLEQRVISYQ